VKKAWGWVVAGASLNKRTTLVLTAMWIAAIAVLLYWLRHTPDSALRSELSALQFWVLEAQFVALVALTFSALRSMFTSGAIDRRGIAAAGVVAIGIVGIAAFVVPRTNRIFYDEQIYEAIGRSMSDQHVAQMCNDGNVEYGRLICYRGEYNKQPHGYPYLLSLAYRVFGVHAATAQWLNCLSLGLLVLVVFLTVMLLTGEWKPALLSGLVMGLIPEQLLWSNTAASEPTASLFCALAFLAAVCFARQRTSLALAWMLLATVFAMQFRPESVLIAAVVLAVVAVQAPRTLVERRFWLFGVVAFVLVAPLLAHLYAVRGEGWGTTGDRISLSFLLGNLKSNGLFYLNNERFPALCTLLAVAGILSRRRWQEWLLPLGNFLAFFGVYLLFYAGSYDYGADVRYSLLTYPPLAVLAGLGAKTVHDRLEAWRGAPTATYKWIVAAVGLSCLWFTPLLRAEGEEAWGARADVAYAKEFAKHLPKNSYVLTHNPHMFLIWGVNAGQTSLVTTDESYVRDVLALRYSGGLYLHWNYWCNVDDPAQVLFCRSALDRFPHELVDETRVRNYRYAFYRLITPGTTPRPGGTPSMVPGRHVIDSANSKRP